MAHAFSGKLRYWKMPPIAEYSGVHRIPAKTHRRRKDKLRYRSMPPIAAFADMALPRGRCPNFGWSTCTHVADLHYPHTLPIAALADVTTLDSSTRKADWETLTMKPESVTFLTYNPADNLSSILTFSSYFLEFPSPSSYFSNNYGDQLTFISLFIQRNQVFLSVVGYVVTWFCRFTIRKTHVFHLSRR